MRYPPTVHTVFAGFIFFLCTSYGNTVRQPLLLTRYRIRAMNRGAHLCIRFAAELRETAPQQWQRFRVSLHLQAGRPYDHNP